MKYVGYDSALNLISIDFLVFIFLVLLLAEQSSVLPVIVKTIKTTTVVAALHIQCDVTSSIILISHQQLSSL